MATSLQPLIKDKSTYTELNEDDNTSHFEVEDNKDADEGAGKPTHPYSRDPNRQKNEPPRCMRYLFLIVILILVVFVGFAVVLFAYILDLNDDDEAGHSERQILFISHPNSKIYTMDDSIGSAESICVDVNEGRFLYVGNKAEIYAMCKAESGSNNASNSTNFIEYELNANHSIIPGLIDAHAHIMSYGAKFFQVDLRGATSIQNLCQMIEAYIVANNYSTSQWIIGWGWSQNSWSDWNETQLPTRWDLDDDQYILQDYKLWLTRIDGTSGIGNTQAIMAAFDGDPDGLTNTADPEGGQIVRDANGNATGMLVGTPAMWLISDSIPSPSPAQQKEMLHRVLNECSANGLTGIHDAGNGPAYIELYKSAIDEDANNITVRINAFASAYDHPSDYELMNLYRDLLTVRSVKHYMDGSLGPWGASLLQPYCDDPSKQGVLRWNSVDEYYQNISTWHRAGFQIATHAIGDNANRIVIDSYQRLIDEFALNVSNHRLRIEHCQIINRSVDIPRLAQLHIIPSMQPAHCPADMVFAVDRLNCTQYGHADRLSGAYAWQSMIDAGVDAMPFGSDFPAVGVVNPFLGIYAAVTRMNESGWPIDGYPMQYNKVSMYQAIKGYSVDAAYAAFQENELGSIANGKYADFVVIDRDLFALSESDYAAILDTRVLRTYLGGNIVFDDL